MAMEDKVHYSGKAAITKFNWNVYLFIFLSLYMFGISPEFRAEVPFRCFCMLCIFLSLLFLKNNLHKECC